MTTIKLEIKTCQECPFFNQERFYTGDSWEHAFNWFCTKEEPEKIIANYVEWHEEKGIKVPDWCQIKI